MGPSIKVVPRYWTHVAGFWTVRWPQTGAETTKHLKVECVSALKGLALPGASHSDEIALVGSRCLRSTLAAAPVLFALAVVTVTEYT